MHDLARNALKHRFHNDFCTITALPRAGTQIYDEVTFKVSFPAASIHYEGPCVVDERAGVRRDEVGEAEASIQGAEIRIVNLPETVEVGMRVLISRLPGTEFEIKELSSGTNEATTTLLVDRALGLPTVGT